MTNTDLNLLEIPQYDVVAEDYDDEMILLNLKQGIYYSLNRSGADALIALTRSATLDEATDWMHQQYDADINAVNQMFANLSAGLLKEQLVHLYHGSRTAQLPDIHLNGEKRTLAGYQLDKYQDVQDVLAFDPVHEVKEDEGWPSIQQVGLPDANNDA